MPVKYMCLIYRDETALVGATQAQMSEMMSAFVTYTAALRDAGAFVAGARLDLASTATTLRVREGRTQVLDGPYAETKEQLGGYYIIEAPDLDAAMTWAGRCPGARFGTIELRPIPADQPPGAAAA
jgi:hypothetical protein